MDQIVQANQSAEMPVVSADVAELVKMIDDGQSHNKIFHKMMATSMTEGIDEERHDIRGDKMRILFHSISRTLLRSMLLQTVGKDFYHRDSKKENWEAVYGEDGPGSYVAALYIRGRQGRFLSAREIGELIELLRDYAEAVDVFDDEVDMLGYGHSIDGRATEVLTFAQRVDDEMRSTVHFDSNTSLPRFERPRFGGNPSSIPGIRKELSKNIRHLIDMFETRCAAAGADDADIYQCQSPLMVGNSTKIRRRVQAHYADNSLESTSKVWALTISCLRMMDLPVDSIVVPVFRAWEYEQIDPAEVLGTIIGRSLLPGSGFNVKQPGIRGREGRIGEFDFKEAESHVFYWKPWFKKNLELSQADFARPAAQNADLLEDKREEVERLELEVKKAKERVESAKELLKVKIEKKRDDLKKADELLKSLKEHNATYEHLFDLA